jgi:hypothetical protein
VEGWYAVGSGLRERGEHCQERTEYKDIEINPLQESTEDAFRELNYGPGVTVNSEDELDMGLTVHEVGNAEPNSKEQRDNETQVTK